MSNKKDLLIISIEHTISDDDVILDLTSEFYDSQKSLLGDSDSNLSVNVANLSEKGIATFKERFLTKLGENKVSVIVLRGYSPLNENTLFINLQNIFSVKNLRSEVLSFDLINDNMDEAIDFLKI